MRSTFMGLEASKRGLFTQQSALYTTGHNISNANTVGYSRQRVNMSPTLGYPGIGLNAPKTPGFIGTGVQADSVQRIRDQFIDRQYRQETNKLGYWESRSNAISQMEDIMAEPSEYGLDEAFRLFWNSLEDVSANPEDIASRKVAIQRAQHLADSFNYIDKQLKQIQGNLGNEIKVSTDRVNSLIKQIAELNRQIQEIEPNGYMPNDLYDARDVLVDELNEYLPVSTSTVKSGGNALEIAEGSLTIKFNDIVLVEGKDYATLSTDGPSGVIDGKDLTNLFNEIKVTGNGNIPSATISYNDFDSSKGKLLSLIDSYGHGTDEGYYPKMLADLDRLAEVFVKKFNELHTQGHPLHPETAQVDFFEGTSASTIKVRQEIIDKPSLIAASDAPGEEGNGKHALKLAALQFDLIAGTNSDGLDNATFQSFYQGLIGRLGVDGEESNRLKTNSETIRLTVANNRASMSSVSLDEEMTDMIRFQQAYNANARMITVIDETLEKIINGMGRVGL